MFYTYIYNLFSSASSAGLISSNINNKTKSITQLLLLYYRHRQLIVSRFNNMHIISIIIFVYYFTRCLSLISAVPKVCAYCYILLSRVKINFVFPTINDENIQFSKCSGSTYFDSVFDVLFVPNFNEQFKSGAQEKETRV